MSDRPDPYESPNPLSAQLTGNNQVFLHKRAAWHNLGIVADADTPAVEALRLLGGGFWFETVPHSMELNGENILIKEDNVLVRSPIPGDPRWRRFGYVTKLYGVLQPQEACEMYDENVGEPVETLGFLHKHGRRMFITWSMPSFDVIKGDQVDLYGFLAIGFDAKMGVSLNIVTERVVCRNTWRNALLQALATKETGRGQVWSGKHTQKNMKRDLAEWMKFVNENAKKQAELTKSFFKRLSNVPLNEDKEVYQLLFKAFPDPEKLQKNAFIPPSLRPEEEEKIEDKAALMKQYREGIYGLFAGAGTAIKPNMWGLFNSGTEYFNHVQMEKKPADVSILVGKRDQRMGELAEVLDYESRRK
jgi:hypothetical protein